VRARETVESVTQSFLAFARVSIGVWRSIKPPLSIWRPIVPSNYAFKMGRSAPPS